MAFGEIAELALAGTDLTRFREGVLDVLDREIGFDKATMHGPEGMVGRAYDDLSRFDHLDTHMQELTPVEIAPAIGPRPMVDVDVLSARRRDRLSLYRELQRPERITVMCSVIWTTTPGGVSLSRTARGAQFTGREIDRLQALVPALELANAYVALSRATDLSAWATSIGLTRREREIAALVIRGLTNVEIGKLLGVATTTVRNQLSSVFRRAEVSTRAELVFVATSAAHAPNPAWLANVSHARRA